jgi:hypothetical protein
MKKPAKINHGLFSSTDEIIVNHPMDPKERGLTNSRKETTIRDSPSKLDVLSLLKSTARPQ